MRSPTQILVVDDDDAIRALTSTVLRRRGLRVHDARNGAEALEKMSSHRYALIILDLMMPQISGYEVLSRLGGWPASERPMVLVLTAGAEPKPFDSAFVIGTMHKPFDIALLMDTVTACLRTIPQQHRGEAFSTPPHVRPKLPEEPN